MDGFGVGALGKHEDKEGIRTTCFCVFSWPFTLHEDPPEDSKSGKMQAKVRERDTRKGQDYGQCSPKYVKRNL
jgi:hypothetical protein